MDENLDLREIKVKAGGKCLWVISYHVTGKTSLTRPFHSFNLSSNMPPKACVFQSFSTLN